jgi:hypothetical protein
VGGEGRSYINLGSIMPYIISKHLASDILHLTSQPHETSLTLFSLVQNT